MFISLIVFFEDPFWVGLFTLEDGSTVQRCRVVFGQEPTDTEVYHYILSNFSSLVFHESRTVTAQKPSPADNPKRRQRQAARELRDRSSVTRSVESLKQELALEADKNRVSARRQLQDTSKAKERETKKVRKRQKHKGH